MTERARFCILLLLPLLCMVACTTNDRPVDTADGMALLAKATDIERAVRATSDARTATIQSATISAAQTRDTQSFVGTATAQAIQQRQTEIALNAMSNAIALQQQATIQAATETSISRRTEATQTAQLIAQHAAETMELRASQSAETATAQRAQASSTAYAATSTRSALDLAIALERKQATATVEALDRQREQAVLDAARAQQWNEYFDGLMKVLLGLGAITFLFMLIIQVARYLDALALRQGMRLMETRSGTVLVTAGRGGYSVELIKPAANLLESAGEEYDQTQLPSVTAQAEDLIKVTTPTLGERFIARDDPTAEAKEVKRRLAMRLVRESMAFHQTRGVAPASMNRIASWRDLGWASETWVRAVDSLKPFVIAKPGRAGGTLCGPEYPTLHALFAAIGERRIGFEERGGTALTPYPTVEEGDRVA